MITLNQDAVNKIASGQVITSVNVAIKELIENALDSGAKSIKIKLEDQGLKSLSVTDDGSGITKDGRESIGKAYTTSKIIDFEDLTNQLSTFGFRGEAIHSLCVVGDVIITSKCADEDIGITMFFDHVGNIVKTQKSATLTGTTVTINNLLSVFPVRIQEERANFSADHLKSLLSTYFLAAPHVRFTIDAPPYITTVRPPLSSIKQAFSFEYGSQISSQLTERQVETDIGDIKLTINGLLPSMNCDWKIASTNRMQPKQLILVNGRPVRNSEIEKKINETYFKRFGSVPRRLPRFVISIFFYKNSRLCSSLFDVNKDPAKEHIFFPESITLLRMIGELLEFETKNVEYSFELNDWPSTELEFDPTPIEDRCNEDFIKDLDSFDWKSIGSIDRNSCELFLVTNSNNQSYVVEVMYSALTIISQYNHIDISKTDNCDFIRTYWQQIYQYHLTNQSIFVIGNQL